MGFWNIKKPEIRTELYLQFIETAAKSQIDDVGVFIHIYPCDREGKCIDKIDRINFTCQVYESGNGGLIPFRRQYIKEEIWGSYYNFIDNESDYGKPYDFTVWKSWRFSAFVDMNKFPQYSNYAYILQSLGEYSKGTKGIEKVSISDRGWRDGFYVKLKKE